MVFNLLLEFTGVFSGYGSMASSIRNQERHTGGFCPKSISSCLIECWQISPSILEWANTSVLFWQSTKLVGIPVSWWKFLLCIHLMLLPSHSPELQPAERLWPLTNEPIINEFFETLDDLEQSLFERCRALLKQHDLIRGLTCFHWWPRTVP